MHIILGDQNAKVLEEKYTLLELDMLKLEEDGEQVQAYCLLENIPVDEIPKLEEFKDLHSNLLKNYRIKNWSYCEQAIEHLHGRWGKQLNSFYDEISQRVAKYKENDPGEDWDPTIQKF